MFNVPGWSISAASLKTQGVEKTPKAGSDPTGPAANQSTTDVIPQPSKKRKRAHGRNAAVNVTADNLAALWERHVEGKAPIQRKTSNTVNGSSTDGPKADPKRQRKEKQAETKIDQGKAHDDDHEERQDAGSKEKFEKRKTLKQKRREKRAAGDLPPSRPPASVPPTQSQSQPSPAAPPPPPPTQPAPPTTKLTPLQASMRQKLISARFRHLNQTMYTTPSTHTLSLFAENPQMFEEYHEGFRRQVGVWPENPVDGYIKAVQERGKKRFESQKGRFRKEIKPGKAAVTSREGIAGNAGDNDLPPLPRTDGTCTIVDLGCGDARLAQALDADKKRLKLKILSFDLHSPGPFVTKADIAHLPLADGSVDVAIFCLALMGTNWIAFIDEAWRALRWKGELWVAEIKSRFGRVGRKGSRVEHSVGNKKKPQPKRKTPADTADDEAELTVEVDGVDDTKAETDVSAFVEVLRKRGFALKSENAVDLSNKMFVKMEFVKALTPVKGKCVPDNRKGDGIGAGSRGEQLKKWAKPKFVENTGDDLDDVDEGKVLKPCVYKLR